jgi:hypothetical protein
MGRCRYWCHLHICTHIVGGGGRYIPMKLARHHHAADIAELFTNVNNTPAIPGVDSDTYVNAVTMDFVCSVLYPRISLHSYGIFRFLKSSPAAAVVEHNYDYMNGTTKRWRVVQEPYVFPIHPGKRGPA